MALKRIIGYLLMAPLVLTIFGSSLYVIGFIAYGYFRTYPVQTTFIAMIIAATIGKFLVFVDDEEKKEKNDK